MKYVNGEALGKLIGLIKNLVSSTKSELTESIGSVSATASSASTKANQVESNLYKVRVGAPANPTAGDIWIA